MPNIDPEQLRAFADDGYAVLSEIVSLDLILYFRLRCAGHRERWREIVQDPLLEFDPIRAAMAGR
jgi:hypothetical protein